MPKNTHSVDNYFSAIPVFECTIQWIKLPGIIGLTQVLIQGILLFNIFVVCGQFV